MIRGQYCDRFIIPLAWQHLIQTQALEPRVEFRGNDHLNSFVFTASIDEFKYLAASKCSGQAYVLRPNSTPAGGRKIPPNANLNVPFRGCHHCHAAWRPHLCPANPRPISIQDDCAISPAATSWKTWSQQPRRVLHQQASSCTTPFCCIIPSQLHLYITRESSQSEFLQSFTEVMHFKS